MILVDTSVWVDHLRSSDAELVATLERNEVLMHPAVLGELALGNLARREVVLSLLGQLPRATVATDEEVLGLIEGSLLFGRGIGYVDAGLLASTRLTAGSKLWTRDKRLQAVAVDTGVEVRA